MNENIDKESMMTRYEDEEDLFIDPMEIEYECEVINNCKVIKGTNKIARGDEKKKNPAKDIVLLKNIEEIGGYAFSQTAIEEITISSSVEEISEKIFAVCKI